MERPALASRLLPICLGVLVLMACRCDDDPVGSLSGELRVSNVLDFGRVCVGDEIVLSLAVENQGPVSLRIDDVRVSGGSGADRFTVVDFPPVLARSGQEGYQDEIRIAFSPEAAAAVFSGLVIETDEIERPVVEVSLHGEGDDGPRTDVVFLCESSDGTDLVACATVMLGEVGVGATGEAPLVLQNEGCALLTVTGVSHTDAGTGEAGEIYGVVAPDVPFQFSNALLQTVVVTLAPEQQDAYVGRLEVAWEDQAPEGVVPGSRGINVIAQGVDLDLVVQPDRFTFGQASVGSAQTQTFVIRNLGGRPGQITGIDLEQGVSTFTITPPDLPADIVAFGEVSFDVTFAPETAGHQQDAILVSTDLGTLPAVPIMGGVLPALVVDPSVRLDFGQVAPGGTAVETVTVSNGGAADLEVHGIEFDINPAGVFSFENMPDLPRTVVPGDDFSFDVRFDDNVNIANERGQLIIESDDPAYAQAGYILELAADTEAILPPTPDLKTYVDGILATQQPAAVTVGQTVTFDASGSTSDAGDLTFEWDIQARPGGATADLSSTAGEIVTLDPDFPGAWTIRVWVRDQYGQAAWAVSQLSVSD
jgi:hypothetical protein